MYDPGTPTPSSKEMAPAFPSVEISLIKGLVCQIFGLRAAPKSGKRLICSVVFHNVKCGLKNINTARYWNWITNRSVLIRVLNHIQSLIFAYKWLVGSLVPFFQKPHPSNQNTGEYIAIICGLGWEYNYVCRIHIGPRNLLIVVLAHEAYLLIPPHIVSSKLLPASLRLTSPATSHVSPPACAVF